MFYGIFLHKDKIRIHRKTRDFRDSLSEKNSGRKILLSGASDLSRGYDQL